MSKPVYDSMPADEFIRKYGKPYDPENDDYDVGPFVADIKEGKNDPIYNAHSYHTKVPPRAIIPYVLHYTDPGDIVLDPFCGSGMTGVAAMLCENPPKDILEMVQGMNPDQKIRPGARRAILNDLSPAACHMAYNYCRSVDVEELKKEFERIKAAVKEEFDWLYGTEHYEPAVGLYDPDKPEVAARLKNLIPRKTEEQHPRELFKGEPPERTWELISREEVERRMGPEALRRSPLPKGARQFICIPATIQFTVWSDVYRCEGIVDVAVPGSKAKRKAPRGCGREIVLWDVAVDQQKGQVRDSFKCPYCHQEWKKTQIPRTQSLPVLTNYSYIAYRTTGKNRNYKTLRGERSSTILEQRLINEIEQRPLRFWVPDVPWDASREMWRGGHRDCGITKVTDFFTKRNLQAVSRIWHEINNLPRHRSRLTPTLRFVFSAFVSKASRVTRFGFHLRGNSSITGTLYVGSMVTENNVLQVLCTKLDNCLRAFARLPRLNARQTVAVENGPCQQLSSIGPNSVDYVFVDPPFGSNIFYGDCSFLWESWLGELTDTKQEAVWNKSRKPDEGGKTLEDYADLMATSFRKVFRVLKPGRWATVEFNNSDGRVFEAIKKAARDAGFEIVNMLFLDKDQKSFKQVKGVKGEENVVGHDVLFNLRKPKGDEQASGTTPEVTHELEHLVMEVVRDHLRTLPGRIKGDSKTYSDEHRTTPFLNTMLMNTLIPKGISVDQLNLPLIESICVRYFRKIGNRWYLPGEAVGNHRREDGGWLHPMQAEVAIAGEVTAIEWLREHLTETPMTQGEITPLWQRATVKLTSDLSTQLERLLRQNFWQDQGTNKWREPTEEERKLMDTTERERVRHTVERYLSGALSEMPSDNDICEWVASLYETAKAIEDESEAFVNSSSKKSWFEKAIKVYRQIGAIFRNVLPEKVPDDLYRVASRQARMASVKLKQHNESQRAKRRKKDDGQGKLFG